MSFKKKVQQSAVGKSYTQSAQQTYDVAKKAQQKVQQSTAGQSYRQAVQQTYDAVMPVVRKMGRFLSPTNTSRNYSNMHKTYGKKATGDPSKNRSKVGKYFR